jgi:hypothetical protein
MKRDARMATDRRKRSPVLTDAPGGNARPIAAPPPLASGELVSLLQRLRRELEEFLNDLGVCREPSGNRDSSRRA